jgi:multidrug transporter EmrE-like cation transporter
MKLIISLYVITTSLALIFLKLGSSNGLPIILTDNKLSFNFSWYVISGVVLYGISFIIYLYLISSYDLGYIVPLLTALVYIIIFSASFIIFKESFTVLKITGIAFIIAGLILLNIK